MIRAFLAGVMLFSGCAGLELRGQTGGVKGLISQARENGAYFCAPKELALAEANLDFTVTELDQGHYLEAKSHLAVAHENAKMAFDNSPPERCAPKVDTDGDGCLDRQDSCPERAEDLDGFEDQDCCPDPDNDEDAICDNNEEIQAHLGEYSEICKGSDQCPMEPEDPDNFQDEDGCPDLDNDEDKILDVQDQCPNEAEDYDEFEDEDGCPDPDNDQDQILDAVDQCPNEAEDYDGDEDTDGCPDLYKLVTVKKDKIEIKQKIYFKFNKSIIQPRSFALLDDVALVLKDNPKMNIRIEGHTDSRGGDNYNLKLSQKRANSVRMYLMKQGTQPVRLEAQGFGETRPIASNRTKNGREQNRRVEFIITSR